MSILIPTEEDLLYPDSDGLPMAENTEQYQWIVIIKENLEILFANDDNVFIAADLFWYPVQVEEPPAPRQAPDVMVVFGRPKGRRGSYRQWLEADIAPQVVFEILSPSNKTPSGVRDMERKLRFYETYGVEEYYLYDPEQWILQGWQRTGEQLFSIAKVGDWSSPRLQIRLQWKPGQELQLFYPNGQKFLTSIELAEQAEQARQQAEQARQQAEQARQQAEQAQQQAAQAQQQLQQERQTRLAAIPRLRSLGLSTDQIAEALNLSTEEIRSLESALEQ
jgi:Uma2 family endonuclease